MVVDDVDFDSLLIPPGQESIGDAPPQRAVAAAEIEDPERSLRRCCRHVLGQSPRHPRDVGGRQLLVLPLVVRSIVVLEHFRRGHPGGRDASTFRTGQHDDAGFHLHAENRTTRSGPTTRRATLLRRQQAGLSHVRSMLEGGSPHDWSDLTKSGVVSCGASS